LVFPQLQPLTGWLAKAIVFPFGDHAGAASSA
jgi:hypothetical protein